MHGATIKKDTFFPSEESAATAKNISIPGIEHNSLCEVRPEAEETVEYQAYNRT